MGRRGRPVALERNGQGAARVGATPIAHFPVLRAGHDSLFVRAPVGAQGLRPVVPHTVRPRVPAPTWAGCAARGRCGRSTTGVDATCLLSRPADRQAALPGLHAVVAGWADARRRRIAGSLPTEPPGSARGARTGRNGRRRGTPSTAARPLLRSADRRVPSVAVDGLAKARGFAPEPHFAGWGARGAIAHVSVRLEGRARFESVGESQDDRRGCGG